VKVLSLTVIGTPFTGTVKAPFVLQTGIYALDPDTTYQFKLIIAPVNYISL
jgi:hypothetical protein